MGAVATGASSANRSQSSMNSTLAIRYRQMNASTNSDERGVVAAGDAIETKPPTRKRILLTLSFNFIVE